MSRSGTEILDSFFSRAIDAGLVTARFDQSRLGLTFSVMAAEFELLEEIIEAFEAQSNLITATDEFLLERLAAPFYARKLAGPSSAIVTFSRDPNTEGDITIPVWTLVETAEENPIVFKTLEELFLPSNSNSVQGRVQSIESGQNTMVDAGEILIIVNGPAGISVVNEYASWGGTNAESIEQVRQGALSARMRLERGTEYSIIKALRDYGLNDFDYNLTENTFGYGSIALYVDTENPAVLEDIQRIVNDEKAFGIHLICQEATQVDMQFNCIVNIASDRDLTPQERTQLKADIEDSIETYIYENGIGKKLVISKMVHYIYDQLLSEYDISDIHIEPTNNETKLDSKNNVTVEDYEVIKVESMTLTITVG